MRIIKHHLSISLLALVLIISFTGKVTAASLHGIKPTTNSIPLYTQAHVSSAGSLSAIKQSLLDDPTPTPTGSPNSGPPLSLTLTLLFTCCALGLVVGVLVIGFIISIHKPKEVKGEKGS